jgi:hypothetical protein
MEQAIEQLAPNRHARTLGLSWPLIVALLAVLGVLCVLPAGRGLGPDLYWHIAAGNWIAQHATVPTNDPFSHSMLGAAWTAQEWLSEIVLAMAYHAGGWSAIATLGAICYAITLALLTRFLLRRMEPVHALLLVGLAAGLMLTHLSVRPHVLAWPLMALWVAAQIDASESGKAPPRWLLLVMLLWANLHGGFTLGLVLSLGIALDAVVSQPHAARLPLARRWLGFIGLAVLASMATPHGWNGLWYTAYVMLKHDAKSLIDEWQSPNFHQPQALEVWLMLVLALALSGRMRLPIVRTAMLLGLVHLALTSVRHGATLGLVSPFLLALPAARLWSSVNQQNGANDAQKIDRVFRALAAPARQSTIALTCVVAALTVVLVVPARNPAPSHRVAPSPALAAAKAAGVAGPVLNSYNFGGYLIFTNVPVFIDGRSELYGDAFLKRTAQAVRLLDEGALPRLLEDYRIGWTLLEPGIPAVAALERMPGWTRVYADDVAVVHMRRSDVAAR